MYAAGKIPGSLLPPRGPSLRGRHPHLPADRPPAAPVLQEGPAQRDPGRRHDHGAQPRPPVRRRGDQRRVRVHAAGRPALLRPDRRRPRRADQRPVGRVPDAHRARGRRLRHGRRRSRPGGRRRRDHDGRGRGHREDHQAGQGRRRGADRGGRRRRSRRREALHQGAVQGSGRPRREGRQADRRVPGLPRLPGRRPGGAHRRGQGRARPRPSPSPASRSARPSWTASRGSPPRSCSRSSRAARRRSPPRTAR